MLQGFEDAFMDVQANYISLCLELYKDADEINVFIYQDDEICTFNAFFVKDGIVKTLNEVSSELVVDKFLELGVEDIDKLIGICEKYEHKCPNEFLLTYNVKTRSFDSKYGYDDYAKKERITPAEVFLEWIRKYKEGKER